MRRYHITFLLFILAGAFVSISANPRTPDSEWLLPQIQSMISTNQDFRSPGWSQTGHVGVLHRMDGGGGRGGYAIQFLIIDTVHDVTLFDRSVWVDELNPASEQTADVARAFASSPVATEFLKKWEEKGLILTENNIELHDFPLSARGSTYTAKIDFISKKQLVSEDAMPGESIADFVVIVERDHNARKRITEEKKVRFTSVDVLGYFLSPYEPRILVVYRMGRPGFEGETDYKYRYSGCHLGSGFH